MKKVLFILLVLVISQIGFANTSNNKIPIYGEDKPNISVTSKNNTFSIALKSNPTTGYSWFLREYDKDLIAPVKRIYKAKAQDPQLVGAPGIEVWTFKVKPNAFVVPHQTTIRFVYTRPWEGNDNSTQIIFRVSTG